MKLNVISMILVLSILKIILKMTLSLNSFAPLKDSVILYEPEIEYAPAISYKMASQKLLGKSPVKTKNKKNVIKKIAKRSSKSISISH